MPLLKSVTLKKSIAFTSNGNDMAPTLATLEFTPDTLTRIARVQCLVKENNLFSAKIEIPDKVELFDEVDGLAQISEWRYDFATFSIFDDTFYFYAQNKWDSSCQIESEAITLDEIYPLFNYQP